MRRRVVKVAAFLLLGAIVNVAVAWAVAVWPGDMTSKSWTVSLSAEELPAWMMYRSRSVAYERLNWRTEYQRWVSFHLEGNEREPNPPVTSPPRWSRWDWRQPVSGDHFYSMYIEDARGWPMLAARSMTSIKILEMLRRSGEMEVASDGIVMDSVSGGNVMGSVRFWDSYLVRVLPLRPIWPGFIINTLFYALILWLLFTAPFRVRRMLRRKRRLCETCAYPIGVSPVCTECGAAVERRTEV